MKEYLKKRYGEPKEVTKETAKGMKGIIWFDTRGVTNEWINATGHIDLWDGTKCKKKCFWPEATKVYIWEC